MSSTSNRAKILQFLALSTLVTVIVIYVFQLSNDRDSSDQLPWLDDTPLEFPDAAPAETDVPVVEVPDVPVDDVLPTIVGKSKNAFKVKFPALAKPVIINPHANVLNRPRRVVPRDDYLGPRPHVDTEVDSEQIMLTCRGSFEKLEHFRNTSRCLNYLAEQERNYTYLPVVSKRASQQDPHNSEYNADGHDNTMHSYVAIDDALPAGEFTRGTCPGPIIPYHVYWRGPATWRVEIFIKSYLYSQNLPCSQLNLWLDSDPFPTAVNDMLNNDPLFARFLPFVERGDIVVRPWHFPHRIPIPSYHEDDPTEDVQKKLIKNTELGKETAISPNVVQDASGQRYITFPSKQMAFLPVAVSDAVRFVVLHMFGGIYFDMDVLMLRDLRPLLLPTNHSFAERWGQMTNGGYNTAILSMTANSSLSTYFLRGAVAMGLNFHPMVLGIMARKEGRNRELMMYEHAMFDALWTAYDGPTDGKCITPCHNGDYSWAFKGTNKSHKGEWKDYEGPQTTLLPVAEGFQDEDYEAETDSATYEHAMPLRRDTDSAIVKVYEGLQRILLPLAEDSQVDEHEEENYSATYDHAMPSRRKVDSTYDLDNTSTLTSWALSSDPDHRIGYRDSFVLSPQDIAHLQDLKVIGTYDIKQDKFPPTNRTLEHFYRGAYTYHIHNQWSNHPEPNSWLNIIQQAHDGFFDGVRCNAYGEWWKGKRIDRYNLWPEFF